MDRYIKNVTGFKLVLSVQLICKLDSFATTPQFISIIDSSECKYINDFYFYFFFFGDALTACRFSSGKSFLFKFVQTFQFWLYPVFDIWLVHVVFLASNRPLKRLVRKNYSINTCFPNFIIWNFCLKLHHTFQLWWF